MYWHSSHLTAGGIRPARLDRSKKRSRCIPRNPKGRVLGKRSLVGFAMSIRNLGGPGKLQPDPMAGNRVNCSWLSPRIRTHCPNSLPELTTWYPLTNLPLSGSVQAEKRPLPTADLAEVVRLYGLRIWVEQSYKQVKQSLGWAQY
jgi:hypothetical protein